MFQIKKTMTSSALERLARKSGTRDQGGGLLA